MRPPRHLIALIISLAALLAAGLGVASADESIETTEPVDPAVVVLEPGDNLVGWVGEALPVDQLKRRFPAIESVSAWEPLTAKFYKPTSLSAGQGYVVMLSGTESVQWRRPMTPVKGKVTLQRGRNLVTWLGPDDWSLDRVTKGIGSSFVEAEWGQSVYRATDSASVAHLPIVRRGDALWVDVSRNVNWLQPTGISPRVLFPGGATKELQQQVRADVAETLRFFREYLAIEVDYSTFTIYVPKDVDSLVSSILTVQPALSIDSPEISSIKSTFFKVSQGGGFVTEGGETLVLTRPAWDREGDRSGFTWGYSLTVHEYTHVLQHQLSESEGADPNPAHTWMVEGNADWAQSAVQVWGGWTDWDERHAAYSRRIGDLGTIQEWGNKNYYSLGGAGTNHLFSLAGSEAWVDFWRFMAPISFGPLGRWYSTPTFEDAFLEAFDMPLNIFFDSFERSRISSLPQVEGTVVRADGSPLGYVTVIVRSLSEDGAYYHRLEGRTAADGSFSITIPGGNIKLGLGLGACEVYWADGSLVVNEFQAMDITVSEIGSTNVHIAIPDNICVYRIVGTVVNAEGAGINGEVVQLTDGGGVVGIEATTQAGGVFELTIPIAGSFGLRLSREGCEIHYKRGTTGDPAAATEITVGDSDVTGVRFQLTEGLCSTKITGRLLNADGNGIPDVWIYARHEDDSTASTQSKSDGSFSITVPSTGIYRLEASIDSCWVYFRRGGAVASRDQATRITIGERDVTGAHFQLREGQCSTKITGTLLDANGNPLASVRVSAQPDNGRSAGAQTDSDGLFAITVPESGQYRVSARIDGCTVYYKRGGVTGSHQQATQVQVSDSDVTGIVRSTLRGYVRASHIGQVAQRGWNSKIRSVGKRTAAMPDLMEHRLAPMDHSRLPCRPAVRIDCPSGSTAVRSIAVATHRRQIGTAPARSRCPTPT